MNKSIHFQSNSCEWGTPPEFFKRMQDKYGIFDIDVCATAESTKCSKYFDISANGLEQDWSGLCWMNPPYGRGIGAWIKKAFEESKKGAKVVCLIPARTDTAWWHDYVIKHGKIEFLRGRIKFVPFGENKNVGKKQNSAAFPSAVVTFGI